MNARTLTLGIGAIVLTGAAALAEPGVNVTVYNDNLALVRDTRVFSLERGVSEIRVTDVAARIDRTSVLLTGGDLRVLEQNYEYDLAGGERILEKYLDQDVVAVMKSGEAYSGTLLSSAGGSLVLQTGEGISVLTRGEIERIDFPSLPGGLITRPTLVWRLDSGESGEREATLSYLSGGFQWHAEYVAMVNEADDALELNAWVSLENNAGVTFEDANLQLVAGDVNRVQEHFRGGRSAKGAPEAVAMADGAMAFEEESFFEYHLYTLDTPVTLKDRQTKQVTLFPTAAVNEVEKTYRFRGGDKVEVMLEFHNGEDQGLGLALPKGKLRVYKADSRGGAQFVGEDRIDHTPRDEKIEVLMGKAFDIKAERRVMDNRRISQKVREQDIEVELRNHKDEDVTVLVEESAWGDWEIRTTSHAWDKESAAKVVFSVPVVAGGESTLRFTIRTRY